MDGFIVFLGWTVFIFGGGQLALYVGSVLGLLVLNGFGGKLGFIDSEKLSIEFLAVVFGLFCALAWAVFGLYLSPLSISFSVL